jgi:3-oxosteroid 1-dehydrogenase
VAHLRFALQQPAVGDVCGQGSGFVRSADTIEALAAKIGLDPATCAPRSSASTAGRARASTATSIAARRRGSATTPRTARSRRSSSRRSIAAPFLYVSLGTKGGPRTNRHCEVLRRDGSVIGGLYCAGIAMAHPIGTKAIGAGTTIGPCLTFGYIAGRSIARRKPIERRTPQCLPGSSSRTPTRRRTGCGRTGVL